MEELGSQRINLDIECTYTHNTHIMGGSDYSRFFRILSEESEHLIRDKVNRRCLDLIIFLIIILLGPYHLAWTISSCLDLP
jgi:hypothetical protein